MKTAESSLLRKTAEMVQALKAMEHQMRTAAIPEGERAACVYLAERNRECAEEALAVLVARALKQLGKEPA